MKAKVHKPDLLPRAKRSTMHPPWLVCSHCGLVYLRNAATVKAIRQPCPGELDEP